MKKNFNTFKTNKKNTDHDFNLDQILQNSNIDYSEISFDQEKTNILKSYKTLNKKLGLRLNPIGNLKSILPQISFEPILKPLYTIVLTCIITFTILTVKDYTTPVQYTEISVDKGEKITLHVTENITIYLNSESSIKIPLELKSNSKIILEGEAYFEISHNKKITIEAGGIIFESSDCNFNINSKSQNELIAHVKTGTLDLHNPKLPKSVKLAACKNDKVSFYSKANFIAIEKENSTNYLAWHSGILEFDNTSLYSAINTISEYFEVPIKIENKELLEDKLTAQFRNLEIDEILDIIQSKFNCEISGDGSKLIIN
jgi:ferric-dicitrate binding protein FerR (iron transport regulator)